MTPRDVHDLAAARRMAANGEAKAIRLRANVPQDPVATACGTTHTTISRWESGRRLPTGMAAVRWARLMRSLAAEPESERSA